MAIAIRILGPLDLPLLEAVRPDVFDDPVEGRFAASFLADPRHHLAAALDGDAIVAFASGVHYLHPDKPAPELWINEVGVAEGWRRQGLGRAVVEALLAHGRGLGCREAWVATERDNIAARRLYAACGGGEDADDVVVCSFPLSGDLPASAGSGSAAQGKRPVAVAIRSATPADAENWLRLRRSLWPEGSEAEHREEIDAFFSGAASDPHESLLAEDRRGHTVGLAELSLRPCAEGCLSSPVAYLEGWYVDPASRRRGIGRALVAAAEDWARRQGCRELASDTALDDPVSAAAHRATGFTEAGLVRCFRKDLERMPGAADLDPLA